MAEGSVEKKIDAPPEAVWALAGSFDGVEAFFPGIESFRIEGDDRVIGMFGLEVRERLLGRDDEAMTLEYSVVDGVPLDSHRARISVAADGAGSLVTWSYDVEPESMAPVFEQTYSGALDELATKFT
jgi:carbon monoxide dehydrogenase subunit G